MVYDKDNVFAKIIKKELKAEIIDENIHAMAFNDIAPRAPVHILIIPKKEYTNYHDFISRASHEEIINIEDSVTDIDTELLIENETEPVIVSENIDEIEELVE